jgi:hypothetical protein
MMNLSLDVSGRGELDPEYARGSGSGSGSVYRVNDVMFFAFALEEFRNGAWAPFDGARDIQFEWTMLDPHVRAGLKYAGEGAWIVAVAGWEWYRSIRWISAVRMVPVGEW